MTTDPAPVASNSQSTTPPNSEILARGFGQCDVDADCHLDLGYLSAPASVQLLDATCAFESQPVCACYLRRVSGSGQTSYFTAVPGRHPGGCSEYSRTPGCLYCESEFSGCNSDEPGSCDAVCADFVARKNQDLARTVSVRERLARCTEQRCQWLYEIEGKCYVGEPGWPEARGYDCSLSDDELLAHSERETEPSCPARPLVSCASAEDCPRALACKDSVCSPCKQTCSSGPSTGDEPSCTGGGACAGGETCVASLCVPDADVTCRDFDCGADQACAVSGVDWSTGRGNEHSRTVCVGAR